MVLNVLMFICVLFLSPNEDKIEWSEGTQLLWEDFNGRPNNSIRYNALSNLALLYSFKIIDSKTAYVEIKAVFYKKNSWVKPKEKTGTLLSHENLHFDIAEVYARRVRKEIQEYLNNNRKLDISKLNKRFSKIYNKLYDKYEKHQQLYDKETAHSTNYKEQKKWEDMIKKELVKLNEFAKPIVEISKFKK